MENEMVRSKRAEMLKRFQQQGVGEKKEMEEACIILLDRSGSMNEASGSETKIGAVKKSVPFLSAPGHYINYSLIAFNDFADVIAKPTTGFGNVIAGLDFLMPAGGTCFSSAISLGLSLLKGEGLKEEPQRKRMILLSDGQNNVDREGLWGVVDRCVEEKVVIDTLAFGRDADTQLLQEIARKTGGKYQFVDSPLALEQAYRKLNFNVRWIEHKKEEVMESR